MPYERIFNFSAGPSTLPVPVLEQVRDELLNYRGTGMSVMEMSHRSAPFEAIIEQAEADLRTLLAIPSDYRVLFLSGGASMQFSMVPLNFLLADEKAGYVITGAWGNKALDAARKVGAADAVWDDSTQGYRATPDELIVSSDLAYLHVTSNETIQGVQFTADPVAPDGIPLICDMSSDIASRPIRIQNYDLVYGGAQKNIGPAGVTIVIISERLLDRVPTNQHAMLDYRLLAKNKSLYNTPPCFPIYVSGLVYQHLLATGGLEAAGRRNAEKAAVVYEAIDHSNGFYIGHANTSHRSLMNVTFNLADENLSKSFSQESTAAGFDGLKGHRDVGGFRASIYNAMPLEGCVRLAEFMADFASHH
jgi:phosphoserine aminotransferase